MRASWLRYAAQGDPTHIGLLFRGGVPAAIGTFAGGNASRNDVAVANRATQALIFRARQNANVDLGHFLRGFEYGLVRLRTSRWSQPPERTGLARIGSVFRQ